MEKDIVCTVIGDAMIDIVLPLNDIEDIDHLLNSGTININSVISPGGTANLNNCMSKLGKRSAFIGKIGEDHFGKMFSNDLDATKVIKNVSISNTRGTGIVFDLVFPNGDRSFIVDRGANADLRYEDVNLDLIENSEYLYVTGFSLQDKKTCDTTRSILEESLQLDTTIIFNPASNNIIKRYRDLIIDIIKEYADIVILNESEAFQVSESDNDADALDFLISNTEKVVMTKGCMGSVIMTQYNTYYIKPFPANVIDTTGAGDVYSASFIYGTSKGWKEDKVGEFASKISSKIVETKGSRFSDIYV